MNHQRWVWGVVAAVAIMFQSTAEAKLKHSRAAVAYVPPLSGPYAEYVPARWFRDLDLIEEDAKIPIRDRERGKLLMMRALAGVSEPREYAEAHGILKSVAQRYRNAAEKMKTLPISAETEDMRRGYVQYYIGMAKLCEDCARLRTVDAAKGQYRALTPEEADLLARRWKLLEELGNTCLYAEVSIRAGHGIMCPRQPVTDED